MFGVVGPRLQLQVAVGTYRSMLSNVDLVSVFGVELFAANWTIFDWFLDSRIDSDIELGPREFILWDVFS